MCTGLPSDYRALTEKPAPCRELPEGAGLVDHWDLALI
jgi:hypothetical protein